MSATCRSIEKASAAFLAIGMAAWRFSTGSHCKIASWNFSGGMAMKAGQSDRKLSKPPPMQDTTGLPRARASTMTRPNGSLSEQDTAMSAVAISGRADSSAVLKERMSSRPRVEAIRFKLLRSCSPCGSRMRPLMTAFRSGICGFSWARRERNRSCRFHGEKSATCRRLNDAESFLVAGCVFAMACKSKPLGTIWSRSSGRRPHHFSATNGEMATT